MNDDDKVYTDVDFDSYETTLDRSILFRIDGMKQFVPRKLVGEIDHVAKTFELEEWFAVKEGLV